MFSISIRRLTRLALIIVIIVSWLRILLRRVTICSRRSLLLYYLVIGFSLPLLSLFKFISAIIAKSIVWSVMESILTSIWWMILHGLIKIPWSTISTFLIIMIILVLWVYGSCKFSLIPSLISWFVSLYTHLSLSEIVRSPINWSILIWSILDRWVIVILNYIRLRLISRQFFS